MRSNRLIAIEVIKDALAADYPAADYRVQDEPEAGVTFLHMTLGRTLILVSHYKTSEFNVSLNITASDGYVFSQRSLGQTYGTQATRLLIDGIVAAIKDGRL